MNTKQCHVHWKWLMLKLMNRDFLMLSYLKAKLRSIRKLHVAGLVGSSDAGLPNMPIHKITITRSSFHSKIVEREPCAPYLHVLATPLVTTGFEHS